MGENTYRFKVDPEALDLAQIVERLGAIIAYYRYDRKSVHERTKEVWGALKTLLRMPERKWDMWIPMLAERYTPEDVYVAKDYFKALLHALLKKFADSVRGANPGMKLHLAKIVRSALDSASGNPYPQICFFVREFYPDKPLPKKCEEVIRDG